MAYGDDDWQNEHIRRLSREVGLLQSRLDEYHAHLESSLDHDRQFQMQATWGIVNGVSGALAFLGTLYAAKHWLHMEGWILEGISGLVALCVYVAVMAWSDKGREGDLKKLSRLPKWEADT